MAAVDRPAEGSVAEAAELASVAQEAEQVEEAAADWEAEGRAADWEEVERAADWEEGEQVDLLVAAAAVPVSSAEVREVAAVPALRDRSTRLTFYGALTRIPPSWVGPIRWERQQQVAARRASTRPLPKG